MKSHPRMTKAELLERVREQDERISALERENRELKPARQRRAGSRRTDAAVPDDTPGSTEALLHQLLTEHRKTIEQLRKLSQAVEHCPNPIIIADREGKIEYTNPSFTRLTGYEREEVYGKNPRILKSGHTAAKEYQTLWKTISSGKVWHGEFLNMKKDGGYYWENAWISPITGEDGSISHFVAVKEDINARKWAEARLQNSRERLRNLSSHLLAIREEERTTIAREIHDELGQLLATLRMDISLLADRCRHDRQLTAKTAAMEQIVVDAIKTVQRISAELRPVMLDVLGLSEALKWQSQEFRKRTGIPCEVKIRLKETISDRVISTAIFRIFQEALTNVIRHSGATRVEATLVKKRGRILLVVHDNGSGVTREQAQAPLSLGIIGMRERAAMLGGGMKILGSKNEGTTVFVRVPLQSKEPGDGSRKKNSHSR